MNTCRILVVRLGAMGDILHTLPAVASLKQSFPYCHLAWAVEDKWAVLLEENPFIDEIIRCSRTELSRIVELRRHLRASHWDFAVDFQGLLKSAFVCSFARPERIVGFHHSQIRERLAALFYSHSEKTKSPHIVDRNLELAKAAGATAAARLFPLPAGTPEGSLPDGDFILASPLAGWQSKQWPLAYYQELQGLLTVPIVMNVPPGASLPGRLHVSGLSGLIDATRRARAILGVDSGPMHLAAALGKSGVAIFGPTDPVRNGPYSELFTVLRSRAAATTYKRDSEIASSMREITPNQVAEALNRILCSPSLTPTSSPDSASRVVFSSSLPSRG